MRLINKFMLCCLAAGWLAVAGNKAASAAPVHEACKADIDHYCDTATAGNGRIMACLYAHENKLSDDCDAATDDVSDILDTVFAKIADVLSQCTADIEKHCGDVKFGEGRILTCLNENSASLTDDCKAVAPQFGEHVAN